MSTESSQWPLIVQLRMTRMDANTKNYNSFLIRNSGNQEVFVYRSPLTDHRKSSSMLSAFCRSPNAIRHLESETRQPETRNPQLVFIPQFIGFCENLRESASWSGHLRRFALIRSCVCFFSFLRYRICDLCRQERFILVDAES